MILVIWVQLLNHGISHELMDEVERVSKAHRSEEHTSELQSLRRISYAVFCLKIYTY